MGYNFINRMRSNDGFVCNMIGRIVLEKCANVEEAILLLIEIPHRHSFSSILIDQCGESIGVEATPREVKFHKSNIRTNQIFLVVNTKIYKLIICLINLLHKNIG
jgi:predicted choloylglycine hydrolase